MVLASSVIVVHVNFEPSFRDIYVISMDLTRHKVNLGGGKMEVVCLLRDLEERQTTGSQKKLLIPTRSFT